MTPPISDDEDCLRSNSRLKSKKGKKPEEEVNLSKIGKKQDLKRAQKVHLKEIRSSKRLKTISTLPYNWCITKVSTVNHSFKWTIENFSFFSLKEPGVAVESAQFKIPELANLQCKLLLYPNGHEEKCKNTCIIFQCLAQESLNINCQFQFFNNCGTLLFSSDNRKIKTCSKDLTSLKFCCLTTKSKLLSLLEDDELFIVCLLSINENVFSNKTSGDSGGHDSQDLPNKLELLSDLDKLYEEKNFSDVALRIEDHLFHAHKSIIVSRSSFFKKIFEHFQNEKHKEYKINNVSPSTFEKILYFIYTGKILDINNSARDLLEAAYKFNLSELKTICERHLMNTLYISNACQNLMLAEKLNASDLKKKAMNLIFAFKDQIIDSSDFELVKNFSSNLYQEILCFVLCDGNN